MGETLQAILKRLALLSMGLSLGCSDGVQRDLGALPERGVASVLEASDDDDRWPGPDRLRLLALLARDPRPTIRELVADHAARLPGGAEEVEPFLARLALDDDAAVRSATVTAIATRLRRAPPADATALVARWAFDAEPRRRCALARALSEAGSLVGARTALAHLAVDPVSRVRRAAVEALRVLDSGGARGG